MTLEVVGGVLGKSSGADNFLQMPTVAGDLMVESGSNADGEWTRWADGTQICTNLVTGGGPTRWTYPSPFVVTSTSTRVSGSPYSSTTDTLINGKYANANETGVDVYSPAITQAGTGIGFVATSIHSTAIGRWK